MLITYPLMQIVNMSSGLASKANLAANIRGEGLYQVAAKMGLAYRSSKAALCMGAPLFIPQCRSWMIRSFCDRLEAIKALYTARLWCLPYQYCHCMPVLHTTTSDAYTTQCCCQVMEIASDWQCCLQRQCPWQLIYKMRASP